MERLVKQINKVYYLVYTATILALIIGYMATLNKDVAINPLSPTGTVLSSLLIIYMLVSIPASLALFYRYTLKLKKVEDEKLKLKKYENAAILRLIVVGISLVSSIVIFFLLRDISIIYCFAISAISLFFCKPNIAKIATELGN